MVSGDIINLRNILKFPISIFILPLLFRVEKAALRRKEDIGMSAPKGPNCSWNS